MGLFPALNSFLRNALVGYGATIDATSKIYGVVPAIVTEVNDAKNKQHMMGKVRVYFPWLQKKEGEQNLIQPWARVLTPNAGKEVGLNAIPQHQPGDEVIVGFEHGDPAYPYVLGSLWNGKNKAPAPTTKKDATDCPGNGTAPPTHKTPDLKPGTLTGDKGANKTYFYRSRSGNMVILDDDAGTVRITENSGNSVVQLEKGDIKLLQKSGDIFIWANNRIRLDCENYEVHAKKKIFHHAKMDWGCKVDGKMTMEAKMNFTAQSKAEKETQGTTGISFTSKNNSVKIESSLAMDVVANQNMLVKASSADVKITALKALGLTSGKALNMKTATMNVSGLMGIDLGVKGDANIKAGSMLMCKANCINLN